MKKLFLMLMGILVTLTFLPNTGLAADMNYSVRAIIPDNQVDKTKTYFDLRMKPGQKQKLTLHFENNADEKVQIEVSPNTATTNRNGVIDYSSSKKKTDSSLKHDFSKLVTGEKIVTLNAKEKKDVDYEVTMPEKDLDGILLGGFYIHKKQADTDKDKDSSVQIKNDYSYVIGVRLSENDNPVSPKLKLNQIEAGLENYHTVVNANLQNTTPVIISNMKINAKVTKAQDTKILHQVTKENQSMAPNSNYDFSIPWNDEELKAGKYHLSMTAKDQSGHKWKFEKDFEIGDSAKAINKEAVGLEHSNIWLILGLSGTGLLILLLAILFFVRRKRKNKEQI
ncbi:DUF916 and DUF3324 domain-containing protein [Listeria aquatica]|uniref:DUF916 and DUF3324 domain-containing protein n=1 Tax=Listeria aquatica TaxID=1494960 RepID=UPI003F6F3733